MIPTWRVRLVPTILLALCLGIVPVLPSSAQHGSFLPGEVGLDPLTRGAMHEGFARPVAFDPAAGEVVTAEPPLPIDEELPDYRLRGKSVGWMPGYWSWDNHRDQFVWTSGFWRVWPRNRDYVPGYWEQIESGWRRTAGFWVPVGTQKIHYYPALPKSQEAGPTTTTPSADHIWLPGRYIWKDGSFHWRKGFWGKAHLGWIWMPPHHVWTPAGVVYVDGYWDYAVDRRGLLFAPISIPADVQEQPNLQFRARVVLDAEMLLDHLFCRVLGCCYCFGDYYATGDYSSGIYPWFVFHLTHGYDPLHAYYSWLRGRDDPGWQAQLAGSYRYRTDHEQARPTETFFEQQARFERQPSADAEQLALGRSLQDMASTGDPSLDLVPKSGPRPGGGWPLAGRRQPIVTAADRATAEAKLAALRRDPAHAGKVLLWELPRPATAQRAVPPAAPAASQPLARPALQPRGYRADTLPSRAPRGRRMLRPRRDPRRSFDSLPSLPRPSFQQPVKPNKPLPSLRQPVKPNKPRRVVPQVPQKSPLRKKGR